MNDAAREDALADMESEGFDISALIDEINEVTSGTRVGYVAAYLTENADGSIQYGICKAAGATLEEAVGRMYLELCEEYPTEEGWSPPHLTLDDDTFLIVPGVSHPILNGEEEEEDDEPEGGFLAEDGSCGDCGNPQGPCPNIDECPHFPEG